MECANGREGKGDRNTALESEGYNSEAVSIWLRKFWLARSEAGTTGDLIVGERCLACQSYQVKGGIAEAESIWAGEIGSNG